MGSIEKDISTLLWLAVTPEEGDGIRNGQIYYKGIPLASSLSRRESNSTTSGIAAADDDALQNDQWKEWTQALLNRSNVKT